MQKWDLRDALEATIKVNTMNNVSGNRDFRDVTHRIQYGHRGDILRS